MGYRVYCEDRVWDSAEGGNPPAWGVQVVVQEHPDVGKEVVTGADFYVLRDGRWYGVDKWGLIDWCIRSGKVLVGRQIDGERYSEIMAQAMKDKEKTGWLPFERKPE